jgi:hypothetical protein
MARRYKKFAAYLPLFGAVFLGAWLFSRLLSAWPAPSGTDGASPSVVLASTQRDLGIVSQGTVLRTEFSVTNAGTRRLILREEGQGCCGRSTRPSATILPPGGSKDLLVEVDTTRWHGRMEHAVHYLTNDPQRPRFTLTVKAVVESGPPL